MLEKGRLKIGAAVVVLTIAAAAPASGEADPLSPMASEAWKIASGFAERLKTELMGAMKSSGPVHALEVCNTAAPAIAKDASAQGWTVGRTSLKPRNESNAPGDAWQKQTLAWFEAEKARGVDPAKLEKFEIAEKDGAHSFRYMKAIVIAEPCLACHGETIAAPVKAKLDVLYPHDQATGYKLGDIRGAFIVSKEMK
jgi:hypothetical protein